MAATETLIGPNTCYECGGDYGEHREGCPRAPNTQNLSEPIAQTPQVDSWVIVAGETTVIRDKGSVVYCGLTSKMPLELQILARQFTVEFAEVAHKLLGTTQMPAEPESPITPGPSKPTDLPYVLHPLTLVPMYQMQRCEKCGQLFALICPCTGSIPRQ